MGRTEWRQDEQAALGYWGSPGCWKTYLPNVAGRAKDDWLPAAPQQVRSDQHIEFLIRRDLGAFVIADGAAAPADLRRKAARATCLVTMKAP
jgi:hypothetical protein